MEISRNAFVLALWATGFDYVTNTSCAQVYWRNGSRVIEVPKTETVDYAWAIDSLVRCGINLSEAERLLAAAKVTPSVTVRGRQGTA